MNKNYYINEKNTRHAQRKQIQNNVFDGFINIILSYHRKQKISITVIPSTIN